MSIKSINLLRHPFSVVLTSLLASALLAAALLAPQTTRQVDLSTALLALALAGCAVLAYQFPIHVDYRQKLELYNLPLFLLAVLLPLPQAMIVAGGMILVAELSVVKARGNYPSDVLTQTTRLMIVVGVANVVGSRLGPLNEGAALPLLGTALAMWLLDYLTTPLLIAPVTGESALQIIRSALPQSVSSDLAQYGTAMLGAVALVHEPIMLIGLVVPTALMYRAFKSASEMQRGTMAMLENLADTVDLRDPYTGGHSRRVTEYCEGILRVMHYTGPDADLILTSARVHDIGKIGVPDYVLNKPGPLTTEEREIMETHAPRGADLLKRYSDFARGVAIVRHHHERWDGEGYPDKLKGTEIPLGARIIAVADSFDAMTSDRPYRRGMADARAAEILRGGRSTQWDAEVVEAFMLSIAERLALAPEPAPALAPAPVPQADTMPHGALPVAG